LFLLLVAVRAVASQQQLIAARLFDLDESQRASTGERLASFGTTPTERIIAAIPPRWDTDGPRDNRQSFSVL
jgi:hypothetical protein